MLLFPATIFAQIYIFFCPIFSFNSRLCIYYVMYVRDHSNITQSLDWVDGFIKWPFSLTITQYIVGGSEKVQKPAYVIFEWSLI